jgi:hypothetical protein
MAGNKNTTLEDRARKVMAASKNKATKGAPRSKRPGANLGPARIRYWAENRLEKHKVAAIVRATGMTRVEAANYWHSVRQGRKKN